MGTGHETRNRTMTLPLPEDLNVVNADRGGRVFFFQSCSHAPVNKLSPVFLSTTLITLIESQMKYASGKKAGVEWDKRAYRVNMIKTH